MSLLQSGFGSTIPGGNPSTVSEKAYADLAYAQAQQAGQVNRPSQLLVVANRHSEVMAHLSKRLDILAQRLQPLLRPSSPTNPSTHAGRPPESPMSPLAQALSQVVDEVERMNMIVEDLLDRIEI